VTLVRLNVEALSQDAADPAVRDRPVIFVAVALDGSQQSWGLYGVGSFSVINKALNCAHQRMGEPRPSTNPPFGQTGENSPSRDKLCLGGGPHADGACHCCSCVHRVRIDRGRTRLVRVPAADGQRTSSVTSGGQLAVSPCRRLTGSKCAPRWSAIANAFPPALRRRGTGVFDRLRYRRRLGRLRSSGLVGRRELPQGFTKFGSVRAARPGISETSPPSWRPFS
jgi:hypothetical protein